MKYDFRKVLGKSSAGEQAEEVIKELLSQISDQEDNSKKENLLFTLLNEQVTQSFYITIYDFGYVKLKSLQYADALIVFLEVKRLLQEDGYKIIDTSEESFAITF